ncbi:MAG TPA: ATPase [Sulfurospirillum sp. UBA12182]|jgi:MinD superfamily P-loop ATPase|nr:MAG TPA: ATPase [Sulfurospirillum sp. UBA12182]
MRITIASGKGGTGKTTISTNLSHYLSRKRQLVLVDLDVEEPNSGLFLDKEIFYEQVANKMIPEWQSKSCILCGECAKVCNFNAILKIEKEVLVFPELCHSCYACSELCFTNSLPMKPKQMGEITHYKCGTFDFIEGRLRVGEEQAVPLISQCIEYVDESFEKSFLRLYDAPPGTSCPVIEASKKSDFVFLVTEPTPFGLNDLRLAVETMKVLKRDFGVIINRYGIGDRGVEEYCEKEGIGIIAKIPNDKAIAKLYSNGELVYEKHEGFRRELEKISSFIGEIDA